MRRILTYLRMFLCIFFLGCSNIANLEMQKFKEATRVDSLEESTINNSQEVSENVSGEIGEEIED